MEEVIRTTIEDPIINADQDNLSEYDVNKYSYMMYNGTNKFPQDLRIGDELMGEGTKPSKILDIYPIEEKCYLLTPTKGDEFIIGESEILSLSYSTNSSISEQDAVYSFKYFNTQQKKLTNKDFAFKNYDSKEKAFEAAINYKKEIEASMDLDNGYFDISTKEFLNQTSSYQIHCKIYRSDLQFPHVEPEIDLYIIGIWLGDGTQAASHITSADPEIVDYFRDYFEDFNLFITSNGISHRITSRQQGANYPGKNVFIEFLRKKSMYDHKHIPMEYLLSSRQNRLALLAGLLDSDGSLDNNCYDFIQKREHLLDQVIFLCRSLKFSCYKMPCIKVCTNAPNGPKPGLYFRCCISGEGLEEIPTILNRKKAHERQQIKRVYVNGFELKDLGILKNYKIITDTTKFLMSDFTVRHRFENIDPIVQIASKKISNCVYGYKRGITKDGDIVVISEEEAIVVRFIFELYRQKPDIKNIIEELNKKGFKTRYKEDWNDGAIRSIMAHNEKYLGGLTVDRASCWPKILNNNSKDILYKRKLRSVYGYDIKANRIVEEHVDIVKYIFNEYYMGATIKTIADSLNLKGVKPIRATLWSASSVNNLMKRRDIYLGDSNLPRMLDEKYRDARNK